MRRIVKTKEPKEWCEHRNSQGATFDGDGAKKARDALRAHLLKEQGFLCAYCQRRINTALPGEVESTRMEHMVSQSVLSGNPKDRLPEKDSDRWWFEDKELFYGKLDELTYTNLVLCCDGNIAGSRYGSQNPDNFHCDRSKGDHCIHFDLRSEVFISSIGYGVDGKILSPDSAVQDEFDNMLNLNLSLLRANRKAALEGLCRALTKVLGATWRKADLEKWLEKVESRGPNGMYMEYSGILSWYLRKKIRKAQK